MDSKIQDKLKKIKELAERGVGGERETAKKLYENLLKKYELSDDDIEDSLQVRWFRFKDDIDKKLLIHIFYKVTGDSSYWTKKDKRMNLVGCECTEFESDEIVFYYQFYREHLNNEIDIFMSAFMHKNRIYPDVNARVHGDESNDRDYDLSKAAKIINMANAIDRKTPLVQIEEKDT